MNCSKCSNNVNYLQIQHKNEHSLAREKTYQIGLIDCLAFQKARCPKKRSGQSLDISGATVPIGLDFFVRVGF